jgi:hypothetical protein
MAGGQGGLGVGGVNSMCVMIHLFLDATSLSLRTVSVLVRSKPYPCLQENAQRQFIVHSKLTYERELDIVSMCRLRNACKQVPYVLTQHTKCCQSKDICLT